MGRTFISSFYWVKSDTRAKFLVLSDLHFNANLDMGILFKLILEIESNFCDYILIAGDLIDGNCFLEERKNYEILKWFLKEISKKTPVIMVLGEHDMQWSEGKKIYLAKSRFLLRLADEVKNVYLLRDEFFEDRNVRIFGAFQCPGYINHHNPEKVAREEYDALVSGKTKQERIEIEKSLISYDLSTSEEDLEKINVLLIHSNRFMREKKVRRELEKRFNLVISGHKHNWGLPNWLFRIVLRIFGFSPTYQGNLWSIVCRPVTVFPRHPLIQKLYKRGYSTIMMSR